MRTLIFILACMMVFCVNSYAAQNMLVNPDFNEPLTTGWNLEVHGSHVEATMALDSTTKVAGQNSARIDIKSIVDGAEIWRLQFKQVNVKIKNAQTYTWSFWAKANADRPANVWVGMEVDPWGTLGSSEEFKIGTNWQEYHFTFNASQAFDNTRLAIQLAGSKVTPVWIDHQMLYEGEYVKESTSTEPIGKITSTWGKVKNDI